MIGDKGSLCEDTVRALDHGIVWFLLSNKRESEPNTHFRSVPLLMPESQRGGCLARVTTLSSLPNRLRRPPRIGRWTGMYGLAIVRYCLWYDMY